MGTSAIFLTKFWLLQNSRLHFIGTWRNRYRKRFPNFSNGFECTKSSVIASATHEKTAIVHVDMVNSKFRIQVFFNLALFCFFTSVEIL